MIRALEKIDSRFPADRTRMLKSEEIVILLWLLTDIRPATKAIAVVLLFEVRSSIATGAGMSISIV